jgi:hypothetical protein
VVAVVAGVASEVDVEAVVVVVAVEEEDSE